MKYKISAIDYYLPALVQEISELQKDNPNWDIAKIFDKTGISKRYIADANETAADLAYKAAEKLLSKIDRADIDLLILVTQSADYALPTTACILQDRLQLSKSCMAFDINLGCSGFIYALSVAGSLIETEVAKKGLILCADTYTKYIAKDDRTCRPIFSDAAAAILVEKNTQDLIGPFEFGTDGSGYSDLIVRNSAARKEEAAHNNIVMNGSSVLLFTLKTVPDVVQKLLARSSVTMDDIDLIIFHQASKVVIDNLTDRLAVDPNKIFTNYEEVGNTVSASIPIALQDASSQGRLKNGDLVMAIGFGVGLSWGATLIKWTI